MTATSRRRGTSSPQKPATVRVAVYCRVSTDDRLDMEFNSLDAQRQAVEAYVESQRGEGWVALRERYTDGGYTGANTHRPAFERLLNDVETGKVDCVAVYKIDRLSRSLVDFARIMDLFERSGVTFVSVTQQFTTTSSMGRLTLNILMSFAEFERQTIAERTRDKMAAARKKGLWTGGVPPLGYRVENKRLVLNEQEAQEIRKIFQLYLDVGSAFAVAGELNRRGWKTKTGRVFDRHSVQRILTNPLYAGKVRSEGQLYDGAHEATVDQESWEAVERNLKRSGKRRGGRLGAKSGAFLGGLVRCGVCGSPMTTHTAQKRGRRYAYYVCQTALRQGAAACPRSRAPVGELDEFVIDRVREIGRDTKGVRKAIEAAKSEIQKEKAALERELKRLEQREKELSTQRRNLLDAVATNGPGVPSVFERLGDVEAEVDEVTWQSEQLRSELGALEDQAIDEVDLRRALAAFDPLWDDLLAVEKASVLGLVIEEVIYDAATGEVGITFRPGGVRALARRLERETA